jgi:hypothetical protein
VSPTIGSNPEARISATTRMLRTTMTLITGQERRTGDRLADRLGQDRTGGR